MKTRAKTIAEKRSSQSIAVSRNAAPPVPLHQISGEPFAAILGSFTAPVPARDLSAVIQWGDGRQSNGKVTSVGANAFSLRVSGKHTYLAPGTYRVQVQIAQSTLGGRTPVACLSTTVVATAPQALPLAGTLTGTYTRWSLPPVAGPAFSFKGAGNASIMGGVTVSGTLGLPNDAAAAANLSGTLRLANSRGAVTLHVTAPFTSETPLPKIFSYTVALGTGIYSGSTGAGELAATLTSTAQGNTFAFVVT